MCKSHLIAKPPGCERRFITCSVITFATVIAITKDLPDVEGDRKYGIETFSTRLGTRAVAFLGNAACCLKYIPALIFWDKACTMERPLHRKATFCCVSFESWKDGFNTPPMSCRLRFACGKLHHSHCGGAEDAARLQIASHGGRKCAVLCLPLV